MKSKFKKYKAKITLGVVHIKATFNNTIVTITDAHGGAIASSSSGEHGFKGAKKSTPYAAQVVVDKAVRIAKEIGLKTVCINVNGVGSQRESAIRAVFSQNLVVTSIKDVSKVAHNGVRPPKRRRT